jgi:hypothetical protein
MWKFEPENCGRCLAMKGIGAPLLCFLLVVIGHIPGWAFITVLNATKPRNGWHIFGDNYFAAVNGFVAGAFASLVMEWITKGRISPQTYKLPTIGALCGIVGALVIVELALPKLFADSIVGTAGNSVGTLIQLAAIVAGLQLISLKSFR